MHLSPPPSHRHDPACGFSILELLIAIAVMTLMLVVALPNVVGRMPELRTRQAAVQVFADLRAARMQAVSASTNVEVSFNTAGGTYTIWTDQNRDGLRGNREETVRRLRVRHGLALQVHPQTGVFNPLGMFESTGERGGLRLRLTARDSLAKNMVVFPSGDVFAENF